MKSIEELIRNSFFVCENNIKLTSYLNCRTMQSSSDVFAFIFKLIIVP